MRALGDEMPNGLVWPRPSLYLPGGSYPYPNGRRRSNVTRTTGASSGDSSNNTTYTFSALSLGGATPSSTRLVVVTVSGMANSNGAATISSATIGGVAANIIVEAGPVAATARTSAHIISAIVPTGTTATVAITFSKGMNAASVDLHVLEGYKSATGSRTYSDTRDLCSVTGSYAPGGGSVGFIICNANSGSVPAITNVTGSNTYSMSNSGSMKNRHSWYDDTAGAAAAHTSDSDKTDQAMAAVIFY